MNKVELAKMLGLERKVQNDSGFYEVHEFSLKDCFKHDWYYITWHFNSYISVCH